jgi:hypothetical protein
LKALSPSLKGESGLDVLMLLEDYKSDYAILSHFKIDKKTLESWHRRGLPKYKLGKVVLFRETELKDLIDRHKIIYIKPDEAN